MWCHMFTHGSFLTEFENDINEYPSTDFSQIILKISELLTTEISLTIDISILTLDCIALFIQIVIARVK